MNDAGGEVLHSGRLEIRPSEGLVLAPGRAVSLSAAEVRLLAALARNQGRVVARASLYRMVWGCELRPGDRSIDVYVHKLRLKLERDVPGCRFIHTHVGFGYRFEADVSQPVHHSVTA